MTDASMKTWATKKGIVEKRIMKKRTTKTRTMRQWILAALVICILGTVTACSSGADGETTVESTEKEKELSRGTVDGNVYTSEFIGLSFTKPDMWVYSTDEEIAQLMDVGAEILNSSNFSAEAAKLVTVYDMMARDLLTGNNINITFENLQKSAASNVTEEQYLAAFEQLMTNQASAMNYKFSDVSERTLAGQTFHHVKATGAYMGVEFDQHVYIRKEGIYMIVMTLSIFDGSDIATYEAMFK